MSSTSIRQPDFRLVFGYPNVVSLWRRGSAEPVGSAVPGSPGFLADLRALAGEVRGRRGRLTVVLPEAEVWRGRLPLAGRTPMARRRDARVAVAGAFGEPPDDIHVVLGRIGRDGETPVAGVRATTLVELKGLLARVGLTATTVIGAGGFPGFGAPPALRTGLRTGLRLPEIRLPALRLPAGLPRFPALIPALTGLVPARRLALGTTGVGALTAAAGVFLLVAAPAPAPVETAEPAQIEPLAALLPPVPEAAPVHLAEALPPAPPALALRHAMRPPARPELPKAIAQAGSLGIPATVATRNVAFTEPRTGQAPTMQLPALTRKVETQQAPNPRPAAPKAVAAAPADDILRPMSRPAAPKPATAKAAPRAARPAPALAPQASAAPVRGNRPEPRPGQVEALVVAALTPSDTIMSDAPPARPAMPAAPKSVAATRAPAQKPTVVKPLVEAAIAKPAPAAPKPLPKPVVAAAPRPVPPKPVVVAAPKPVAPKPVVVAEPRPVMKPVLQTAAAAPTVREVTPSPVRAATPAKPMVKTVAAQPARKPVAQPVRTASLAEPVRKTSARAQKLASPSKSGMSLIGVFSGKEGRHALVLMPDGSIERVRAGDNVRGVQVASIDTSSVRLTGAGRDATLHLPE